MNLSAGGVRCRVTQPVERGDTIELEMELPGYT